MTKLSIIVPIYKIPIEYLHKCLESLVNIDSQDIEIILVDDGSPDFCGEVCEQYAQKDERIITIHTRNNGVSVARNIGMQVSSGKWVTFIDGDDWIESDSVEELLDVAEEINPDIVFFSGYLNHGNNQREGHFAYENKKTFDSSCFEQLIRRVITIYSFATKKNEILPIDAAWGKIYRNDFLRKNNIMFPVGIPVSEDGLFFLYAIKEAEKIAYYDKCVYHYRFNIEGAMNQYRPNADIEQSRYLEKLHECIDSFEDIWLEDVYYLRVLVSMRHCMQQKYFHVKNLESYIKNRKEFIELIKCEPYRSALKTKNLYKSSFMLCLRTILIRMHFIEVLFLMVRMKKPISKVINKLKGNDK